MAARDDSVIRGSLIACMILLVLSLAANYFFWNSLDVANANVTREKEAVRNRDNEIGELSENLDLLKKMLGDGQFTDGEFAALANTETADETINNIARQFVDDMSLLASDAAAKNYPALPELLVPIIRSRTKQYGDALARSDEVKVRADGDIQNAQKQQKQAESDRDTAKKTLQKEQTLFTEDRTRMNQEKEETRDKLTKNVRDFQKYRNVKADEIKKLSVKSGQLKNTIETQRLQLNRLRSDKFETTQGEIRYVMHNGNIVTINLGSADALRAGVTFGVIDRDETRLEDAKVKATLQVTRIRSEHMSECRVVARPGIDSPIIEGDKIYSPFWAPGVPVKIALAGDIDIDGDSRPDNEQIEGMIKSAGAQVAARISSDGTETGTLDASIRFMVIGESPEIVGSNADADDRRARIAAQLGSIKARARELGLTVIPAWKLQAYLKTIDDSVTTPLGSAVRGEDFPPDDISYRTRIPTDITDMHRHSKERMQKDNKVLPP